MRNSELITDNIGIDVAAREAWLKGYLNGEINLSTETLPNWCDSSPEAELLDALAGNSKKTRQAQIEIGDLAFSVLASGFKKGEWLPESGNGELMIKLLSLVESLPTSDPARVVLEMDGWRQFDYLRGFPEEDRNAYQGVLRALANQLSLGPALVPEFNREQVISEMLASLADPIYGVSSFWVLIMLDREKALAEIHKPLKLHADAQFPPHIFLLGLADHLGPSSDIWEKLFLAMDKASFDYIKEPLLEVLANMKFTKALQVLRTRLLCDSQ